MSKLRIGIGRFWHESNSFSGVVTNLAKFSDASIGSGIAVGAAVYDYQDRRDEVTGFIDVLGSCDDVELVPLISAGTMPSGLLTDDAVAETFVAVSATLRDAAFEHYEISNFARNGHKANHNLGYWHGDDYLGLGCGAWGTVTSSNDGISDRIRYRNTPSPEHYLAGAREWQSADLRQAGVRELQCEVEPIDAATALRERLMLGLRLAEGVDVEGAARELGTEPWPEERERAAQRLLARGRLERSGGHLRVPRAQWLFADGTIAELL